MFDLIRNNTKALMFVLVLLIIPSFVLVSVDHYRNVRGGNSGDVATVGGTSITQADWDAAQRQQVERLRAEVPDLDPKLLESAEMKQQTLEALVRNRVTLLAADTQRLSVSDGRVQRLFATDPQFASIRRPDGSMDAELLKAQGMSSARLESELRRELQMRQVLGGVSGSALAPLASTETALDALLQQREVRIARFESKAYASDVKPTDAEIQAYYDAPAHAALFTAPESASVEYLLLDIGSLQGGVTVSDDEARKFYDQNKSRYAQAEERRASHILVKAERSASAADRAKAKAKAEALLAEVRKDPGRFAEIAKKNSDDPGSAERGGDLDYFGRGAMTKPFEDAVFSMKAGETSALVESDFGYHIIRLAAVRGGEAKSFESVKGEIEADLKRQAAQRKFTELADTFNNTVYEQPDSLQPTADKLKLEVRKASGVTRTPAQGADDALGNPKFLAALFNDETIRAKRNTEAIEVGASELAAGRVVSYTPARRLPFEAVKDKARQALVAERATLLARQAGTAKLAAWTQGAAAEGLESPLVVSRAQAQSLPRTLIDAVMKAPAAPLPAWTSVDFGDEGMAVVRIDKLLPRDPAAGDPKQLQKQYAQVWGQAEAEAYYTTLRDRFKVKVTGQAVDAAPEDAGDAASAATTSTAPAAPAAPAAASEGR